MGKIRILSLTMTMVLIASVSTFPSDDITQSFIKCRSSEECGVDECCVLGMMRYSVPTCRKLGSEGDTCRPRGEDDDPQNVTLSYPGGLTVQLSIHRVMCPCVSGLDCSDSMVCTGLDGAGMPVFREDYTDVDEINHLRR